MIAPQKAIPTGAAALAKGLALLDLVADAESPLRFAELMRQSELPKPTFARILRTLIAFGLVRHDEAKGTYTLGPRFLELSHRVWDMFDLNSVALPELERLSKDLGETVALCRLDQDQGSAVYLAARSGAGLGVLIETGHRVPLHCTAAGKALLAFQEPTLGRGLVERLTLERFTETTLTSPGALTSDLALTRARGYAISMQEHLPGVNAVAVAIGAPDGTPLGALAVLAPASRLDETNIHPVGRDLIAAARRITGSAGAVAISSRPQPRNRQSRKMADLDCILPWGAQLGEAPVWHPLEQRLYWVDILRPAVYRFDPTTGVNDICVLDKLVSAVLPRSDGGVMIATLDGIETLDFDSARTVPLCHPERDRPENRLNDAKVGRGGAIWVGSMRMDAARPTGALYRVDPDGSFARKESGVTVSNGLGWSPDSGTFYFVDTVPGLIYAYDSAPGTGSLDNRRVFARIPPEDGRPDGLAIDSEGGVWCALWDGWGLRRYRPDGTLDFMIELPVPRPTSLCFGGAANDTLFITSARTRLPASTLSEAPLSGGLFSCKPGISGLTSNLFTPSG
ncbi:SMP-30/gluconolactonase/LRE family protein [Paracoccus sp. (in: a-proteobacteria)]|uniref:SMP-30/gluconolactonase/LRE family protein n=1 Tax=Paracoccus sp. TaxID=267 RepID=UPI003A839AEA